MKLLIAILILISAPAYAAELPTPESFGAVGDGQHDDAAALDKFFNSWKPANLNRSISLALTPGKTYAYATPVVVTCGATGVNFRLILSGNGSRMLYTGGTGRGYAFSLGRYSDGETEVKKGFYCAIRDVSFDVNNSGTDGNVLLSYADFTVLESVRISGNASEASLKIQNSNSNLFQNVSIAGGDIGALFGDTVNAFNWTGGRVQQCRVGIHYTGTVFSLDGIDCSLCGEACVEIENASHGEVRLYTERLGPRARGNDAACVRLNNCDDVHISGSLNCANGRVQDGTHAGYGCDVKDSRCITIDGSGYLPQRAFVRAVNSSQVVIAETASCATTGGDTAYPNAQPASLTRGLRNHAAIFLAGKSIAPIGGVTIPPLTDAKWVKQSDAAILNENIADYRGDGLATVVSFPRSDPASRLVLNGVPVTSGRYALEARVRLVRFLEPDVTQRHSDLALAYVQLRIGNERKVVYPRLGDGWQDVRVEVNTDTPGALQAHLGIVTNFEPVVVAVDFLRVVKQ